MEETTKRECVRCKKTLVLSCFSVDKRSKTGLNTTCKTCRKEICSEYRSKIKNKNKENTPEIPNEKTCGVCKQTKNSEHFATCKTSLDGLFWRCKPCHSKICKDYHNKGSEYIRKRKLERGPCVDCGQDNIDLLQFDHVRGNKRKQVTDLKGKDSIDKEIEKTEMRCIMCHRYKSARECLERLVSNKETMNYEILRRNREYVRQAKIRIGGCEMCLFQINPEDPFHFACFDFDHKDPSEKVAAISKMSFKTYSIKKIRQEIEKCRLLCASCHWLHTKKQQGFK